MDVQITSPIPGSQNGVFSDMSTKLSKQTERAASKAFAAKNKKYKQIAADNRLSFLPLIFESPGRPAETTVKFLKSMAKHAAEVKKINVSIVFSYMMTRLSCDSTLCCKLA